MSLSVSDDDVWLQWVVLDTNHLSGENVFEFLRPLIEVALPEFVMVGALDGAVFGLKGMENETLTVKEFMLKVSNADQYDWAFFYFSKKNVLPRYSHDESDLSIMARSDFTVRLADSNYFYVYSLNKNLNDYISSNANYGDKKIAKLDDLDVIY